MDIKLITTADGNVEVWFVLEMNGHPEGGILIGQGSSAPVALSGAVANMGEAVQELADLQRVSTIEGYKRREPV